MAQLLYILFASTLTYIIRFQFANIPLNLLEIFIFIFWLVFLVWLILSKRTQDFIDFIRNKDRLWVLVIVLFLISGIISLSVAESSQRTLGLFVVLFLQPIFTYFPASYLLKEDKTKQGLVNLIFILLGLAGIYALVQYFTLWGLPMEWWGNTNEPKRALSFFEYPNAFALFIAPLLAFTLPFFSIKNYWLKLAWIFGVLGLLVSLSRGGWLGLIAAVVIYLIFFAENRIRKAAAVVMLLAAVVIISVPNLRYRLILPFKGEKSAVSRFSLWHTANKMIKDTPITGKGLYGYKTNFDKYNTDPNLGSINYPHNIFLNFWVETGLLGLISFMLISIYALWKSIREKSLYSVGVILFITAIFMHGLVDAPYLKNDLALIFWIILAFV